MIFLSFFFLLKKLVQIYQCYAVLEIIQKRERGGGGGVRGGTGAVGWKRAEEKGRWKKNKTKQFLTLSLSTSQQPRHKTRLPPPTPPRQRPRRRTLWGAPRA